MTPDQAHLRTERLLLRGWRDLDRAPFAAMNADPEVMRHFPAALSRTESDALVDRIMARLDTDGYGLWALELIESGEFIGFTGLAPFGQIIGTDGAVEVGWRLAREAWGHGYATEAGRAALDVAFDDLGLPEVWSWTAVSNVRSQAVMRRLGLQRVRELDHPAIAATNPLRRHVLHRGIADDRRG